MYIIFIVFLVLMILLTISKNYYKYEYFAVVKNCNNKDIFDSINNVSKDINDLKYTIKNQLNQDIKYNEMYKWYLNKQGIASNIPVCSKISTKNIASTDAAAKKAIQASFKIVKDPKPKTKMAAKNRTILNNALTGANNNLSDNDVRDEWVNMVSGETIAKKKCPTRNSEDYNTLVRCMNRQPFNKEELKRILNKQHNKPQSKCSSKINKCNTVIDRAMKFARESVYKFTIPQLKESIKNMKKKSMGKDIKKQGIPKEFV